MFNFVVDDICDAFWALLQNMHCFKVGVAICGMSTVLLCAILVNYLIL